MHFPTYMGEAEKEREGRRMFQIERDSRTKEVIRQNISGEMEYLTFPILENTGLVEHFFTTRTGGVSEGIYSSMNLSFSRGDAPERVLENYRRAAKALHCLPEDMVVSRQTHTTNIRYVTRADAGKGVTRPVDYEDVDGLITDESNLALVTLYADCVPLYFVDPVHGAIGLAHSGWRGTVKGMGKAMVEAMGRRFGTSPRELIAAIGPSICQECYEVSGDVAEEFCSLTEDASEEIKTLLQEAEEKKILPGRDGEGPRVLVPGKEKGKHQLNLWLANWLILRKAGIPAEQIAVTDICTCHNPDYLFSHRASGGKRGNLGAFLMLKN